MLCVYCSIIYFQAVKTKAEPQEGDGPEVFARIMPQLVEPVARISGKTRKVELGKLVSTLEDITTCRLGDILHDPARKAASSSTKLLHEFFTRCEDRMSQHMDLVAADEKLSKVITLRISPLKKAPAERPKRKAAEKCDSIPRPAAKKVKTVEIDISEDEAPTAAACEDADAAKKKKAVPAKPEKPAFVAASIDFEESDNIEVTSLARHIPKGKWKAQRADVGTELGTIHKVYLQKSSTFLGRDNKERHFTLSFSQVIRNS